jgi:glutathione S-transferase
MYTLYWNEGGANMVCHAALIEIGAPYALKKVDRDKGELTAPEYRKLNPHARVPTLVVDGEAIYESAAILLYLCERHPAAGLMPAPDSPDRGLFLQLLFYLTNTVQEELNRWWHAEQYVEGADHRQALVEGTERRLARMWQHLDDVLGQGGPFLLGSRLSAVDMFLAMLTRWTRNMAKPATTHPHIARLVEAVQARPAYRRMLQEEGLL